jgi:hypothetical protein
MCFGCSPAQRNGEDSDEGHGGARIFECRALVSGPDAEAVVQAAPDGDADHAG